MPVALSDAAATLLPRLQAVTLRDEARLARRIQAWAAMTDPAGRAAEFATLAGAVAAAERRLVSRGSSRPQVTYPDLPVSGRRDDIMAAIAAHQVVVVAGETGSGKTTQLPKMLLDLGYGSRGTIGHTQPRRIAARAVAERLADELKVGLGDAVGYTVRFTDTASDRTLVRVMTDGVLLAEVHDDPLLLRYDALIIDEAHERSLTIDMLLGYLTRLLPQRPDLRLVITSATIDPQRFADHFGGAPVIEVSGRTYPVDIRYRPWAVVEADPDSDDVPATQQPDDDRDQPDAICDAVLELLGEGPGDVLVFCSGEREIREAAEAITERATTDRRLARVEIVPLFARLSAAEQHRVFADHDGVRVVIATNVAETSLTVPGIRYVVDTGTARISRYSRRTKVQRLPVEPISQASARQRSGRCGRVADGICIRLYAESDHDARPAFTEPEILRTNLASVVLRMAALDVGAVEDFPFVDPPDRRTVRDAVALLEELGAVARGDAESDPQAPVLTPVGRTLSRLPVDPRLARMLVTANDLGCLDDVVVLVAGLSIIDPRERPRDATEAADAAHRRFAQPDSDVLTLLALWRYLDEQRRLLSGSALRRTCRAEFLNYRRIREWSDLVAQLRTTTRDAGWSASTVGLVVGGASADPPAADAADRVHQAVLSGLLSQVGVRLDVTGAAPAPGGSRDRRGEDYLGARGARFAVAGGSALGRRRPRWVMAAELVETSRLFARTVAGVDPAWIEAAAGDLVVRTHSEPRWDRRRAQVTAIERVSLFGLPLVTGRSVGYGGIDPPTARDLFIRHALVDGDWDTHHSFAAENATLLDRAAEREERSRRREVLVGDEERVAFFAARLPADVVSGRHFDRWWRDARRVTPDLLTYDEAWLLRAGEAAGDDPAVAFPDRWVDEAAGLDLPLAYRFAPGTDDDGVSVDIGLTQLHLLSPAALGWLVPGLREELVTALIRGLPKALRRSFAPAPDHAGAVLSGLLAEGSVGREDVLDAVARGLSAMGGTVVTAEDFDVEALAGHLRILVRVVDADGAVIDTGRDVVELRRRLAGQQRESLATAARRWEQRGLREWPTADLPDVVVLDTVDPPVSGYPALVDEGTTVGVQVFTDPRQADVAMSAGVARLVQAAIASPIREIVARLPVADKLALAAPFGQDTAALLGDCVRAGVLDGIARQPDSARRPRTRAGFDALVRAVRTDLTATTTEIVGLVTRILSAASTVPTGLADERAHLAELLGPGFVSRAGRDRLPDLLRYVAAARRRLERLAADPARDAALSAQWQVAHRLYTDAMADHGADPHQRAGLEPVAWMLEEYRVSLFAQEIRTAHPVSEQRIRRAIAAIIAGGGGGVSIPAPAPRSPSA